MQKKIFQFYQRRSCRCVRTDFLDILDFSEYEDIAEEEQVPVLGLGAFGDLHSLVQQQLPVFTDQAEDEWALLHGHPAGSLLPGYRGRLRSRVTQGQNQGNG